jgi:hypothetical protein
MPLDRMFDNSVFKRNCLGWQLQLSLWPRRCYYSDKLIWLTYAYKGTAMICGPGEPAFEHRWIDKHQYLIQRIRGNI